LCSNIEVDLEMVDLSKGEHKKPEFLALNPSGEIPVLKDGNNVIFESSAIIRYLARKFGSDLFPFDDLHKFAIVDALYTHIRTGLWSTSSDVVVTEFIVPLQTGEIKRDIAQKLREQVNSQLEYIENNYFKDSHFLLGDQLTLADVALGTTLSHLESVDFDASHFERIGHLFTHLQSHSAFLLSHGLYYKLLLKLQRIHQKKNPPHRTR